MGTFDPAAFLDTEITQAGSTTITPVPEGEYTAVVEGEPEVTQWQGVKDPSTGGLKLNLKWSIDDAGVKNELQRDNVSVIQSIMLDLTAAGGLDMGKGRNVELNRTRDAVGLNKDGEKFNFRMLAGKVAKIRVKHRVYKDQIFAEVKGVSPLA